MLLEGAVLGRYQLVRQIGSGGMGTVFLAQDQQISRQVAIKVVRIDDEMSNREAAQRMEQLFLREVQAISHLDHQHILPIYDSGQTTLAGATYSYMVMQYCQEGSLAGWLLQHEEDVLPQHATKLVVQAAEALQYAHERGVVHQDVKPSNFLLRTQPAQPAALPELLLTDFGIARFFAATSSTNHEVRGTPFFMAPEQWDGHAVPASDQYALAIMAFHLLTGRYPFEGGPAQLMRQHYMIQPPMPSSLHPQINQMVDGVLLRALAKEPERRMPSIIEFAQALEQACQLSDQTDLSLAEVVKQVRLDPTVVAPTIPAGKDAPTVKAVEPTVVTSTPDNLPPVWPTVLAAPASLSEPQAIFAHQKTDPQTPPGSAQPPAPLPMGQHVQPAPPPDGLLVDQPVPLGWRPATWQKIALVSLAVLLILGGGAFLLFNNLTHASGQKGQVVVTYTTSSGTAVTIIETAPPTRGNTPGNSHSGTTPSASGTTSASASTPQPGSTPQPTATPTSTYPHVPFAVSSTYGKTSGTIIFYNRSVQISGTVSAYQASDCARVDFYVYASYGKLLLSSAQSPTNSQVSGGYTCTSFSFSFTLSANVAGGASFVTIDLYFSKNGLVASNNCYR